MLASSPSSMQRDPRRSRGRPGERVSSSTINPASPHPMSSTTALDSRGNPRRVATSSWMRCSHPAPVADSCERIRVRMNATHAAASPGTTRAIAGHQNRLPMTPPAISPMATVRAMAIRRRGIHFDVAAVPGASRSVFMAGPSCSCRGLCRCLGFRLPTAQRARR